MYESLRAIFVGLGQKVVVGLMLGTIIFMTGSAVVKVSNVQKKAQQESRTDFVLKTQEAEDSKGIKPETLLSPTPVEVKNLSAPVVETKSNKVSQGCVVTIFGDQYEISNLLNTHTGGNIFVCGTDMSQSYKDQHGTNVNQMRQYLILSGNSSAKNVVNSVLEPKEKTEVEDEGNDD